MITVEGTVIHLNLSRMMNGRCSSSSGNNERKRRVSRQRRRQSR